MEVHLFTVIALLVLAVVGISVGVANDAVNFLNSSFGSKVAPVKVILLIAALGIITGVTFSSGMMEVARKGIFNPQYFVLEELLIIFFAVMIQNILLLDLFNTFGLPTSTTVSIVFGLFGGALAVSFLKIDAEGQSLDMILQYINTGKVFAIISAIFLSVVFAFIFGSIAQYISRLIFTFDFEKRIKRYGAIWGGFALTIITYFILIKGAKGASFISADTLYWIENNTWEVILYSFVFWIVILQFLMWTIKVNVLRIVVLAGTFALAMAFAANDLVNFIGAPLAGLNAYTIASGLENPGTATMDALAQPFKANTLILLFSGLVMVITLYLSKKSRTVSKTEISLGRQEEGYERFESYAVSRLIVRGVIIFIDFIKKLIPESVRNRINKRFDIAQYKPELDKNGEPPSFDLVRAAVNLMVASALISYGTSLKLPLSTTYVTFIVAMATALPDMAWGRESAVYRVSGVLTVVGGWFFTAIMATIMAIIVAVVVYYGNIYAVIGLLLLSAYLIYRSTMLHKERAKEDEENEKQFITDKSTEQQTFEYLFENISKYLKNISNSLTTSYDGIESQKLKSLKKAKKQAKKLYMNSDALIGDVLKALKFADEEKLESGHTFAKSLGALHEMAARLVYVTNQIYDYFDNNHRKFQIEQIDELKLINKEFNKIMRSGIDAFNGKRIKDLKKVISSASDFNEIIRKSNKNQLKRIKNSTSNKRRSMLYLNILDDTQGIVYNLMRVSTAFKDFYKSNDIS
ncbi:anion permease [Bacteroidota bacterium]